MGNIISLLSRSKGSSSFETLLSPHLSNLYRQAYHYMGSVADAEDLLQDLLVHLYTRQDRLREVDNLPAWLNRCMYNRFVDGHRKQKRTPEHQLLDEQIADEGQAKAEGSYYHREILQSMEQLSKVQRAVVSMHDIEGFTLPELSEVMNIPVGTLKSHLHRGRKKLRTLLDAGSEQSDARKEAERVKL